MRNASALHWVLLVALLASCSSEPPSHTSSIGLLPDKVWHAAFSPDGRRIATGSLDHTARLWDSDGKQLAVLEGHTAAVRLVVFSPDGSCVVTAADDRKGRLWNSEGELLGVLAGYEGRLSYAAFNADGSRIVATSEDGTARLFPVRTTLVPGRWGLDELALLRFEHGHIPNRMYNSAVGSILEDSNGHYWFGTETDGVCRFDGESLTWFTAEDGLSHNQVSTIQADQKGVVWFGTRRGISRYDGERIITHSMRDYTSQDDWRLETGDLWFNQVESTGVTERERQAGVYRYDGEQFTFLPVPLPEDRDDWRSMFTAMAKGRAGRLWFASWESVVGYDGESFTIIDNQSVGLDESSGFLHVKCGLEDSKGRLWLGNNGIGVLLHDGDNTINFTQKNGVGRRDPSHSGGTMMPQPGDASDGSASLHRVFSIGEDRAGNIWFGTSEQGAWRYDGKSLRNFTAEDGLTSKGVMAIYTDRRGDLWLDGEGVFKFNGASFDRIH